MVKKDIENALKDVRQDLRDMRASLEREMRKENREIKASLEFFNKTFEELASLCAGLKKENSELREMNESLQSDCQMLRRQATGHEQRIVELEQYSRNRNIEIKGVPVAENESLPDILDIIGRSVEESITADDIEVCHRVPCRGTSQSNIIVQFCSRTKRDSVLEKARKKRLSTTDFGFRQQAPIFLNDHLCPALKKLLGTAVAKKKDSGWRFVWTRDGKIFGRKTETSRILRISCLADIDKMQ